MHRSTRAMVGWLVLCLVARPLLAQNTPAPPPADPPAPPPVNMDPGTVVSAATTPGNATSLFRINRPGRYYLAANIAGTAGKSGIEIVADHVTLDLRGFEVAGAPGALMGISASGTGVIVRSGTVLRWPQEGVSLRKNACVLEDVQVRLCGTSGAPGAVLGPGGRALRCTFAENNLAGLAATAENVLIESCASTQNSGAGLLLGSGASVRACTISDNKGEGLRAGPASAVADCLVRGNSKAGLSLADGGTIYRTTAATNGGGGYVLGPASRIEACHAFENGGIGIDAGPGTSVLNCTVRGSAADGIRIAAGGVVRDCAVAGSGGSHANILITGPDGRIEANTCSGAGQGIKAAVAGSFIARNTCSGNSTNFALTGLHTMGPIVTISGTIPYAAGAAGLSPWANFEH